MGQVELKSLKKIFGKKITRFNVVKSLLLLIQIMPEAVQDRS